MKAANPLNIVWSSDLFLTISTFVFCGEKSREYSISGHDEMPSKSCLTHTSSLFVDIVNHVIPPESRAVYEDCPPFFFVKLYFIDCIEVLRFVRIVSVGLTDRG